MTESPRTKSEISIHQLVVGEGAKGVNMPDQRELLRYSLQEGMDILLWRGHFSQPTGRAPWRPFRLWSVAC